MRQSNTRACDDCGTDAQLSTGYGGMAAVQCPDCGDEWVIE